jgi:hypothetical protein
MKKRLALACLIVGAAASAFALYLQAVAMLHRLPKPDRVALDGVTTIDQAATACRRTGLKGWDLAAYAQHLAAHKFTYSRLNSWESPARAFEHGRGYCEQQALALKQIYDRLGTVSRPVFALHCRFPAQEIDGMPWSGGISGHAWLQVKIGGQELNVCPGSPENTPGHVQFEILSPVHPLFPWLRPWTHLGSAIENMRRDWIARRTMSHSLPVASVQPESAAQPIT